jgi:hypothetical protein
MQAQLRATIDGMTVNFTKDINALQTKFNDSQTAIIQKMQTMEEKIVGNIMLKIESLLTPVMQQARPPSHSAPVSCLALYQP